MTNEQIFLTFCKKCPDCIEWDGLNTNRILPYYCGRISDMDMNFYPKEGLNDSIGEYKFKQVNRKGPPPIWNPSPDFKPPLTCNYRLEILLIDESKLTKTEFCPNTP